MDLGPGQGSIPPTYTHRSVPPRTHMGNYTRILESSKDQGGKAESLPDAEGEETLEGYSVSFTPGAGPCQLAPLEPEEKLATGEDEPPAPPFLPQPVLNMRRVERGCNHGAEADDTTAECGQSLTFSSLPPLPPQRVPA